MARSSSRGRRRVGLLPGGVICAAIAGCGGQGPASSGTSLPYTLTTPSGLKVVATGHAASARSGPGDVPGICGSLRGGSGTATILADYCVYSAPHQPTSAGVAFLGARSPDVLIVAAVPADARSIVFRASAARELPGAIAHGRANRAPDL